MGHRWVAEARQLHTRKVPRRNKSRPTRTTPRRFGTKLSQHTPRTACAVQNSPSTSRTALLPVQNSPCSPEMARFGAFSECRESFVPFSPPRSRAGRVLYRCHHQEAEQGEFCTERKAEMGLATTAQQAPPVWRAAAGPGPDKFRMQFKNTSDTTSQTDTN